jgi:hypothetical protein
MSDAGWKALVDIVALCLMGYFLYLMASDGEGPRGA